MSVRVTVIPGDGIGPEVVEAALDEMPSDFDVAQVDAGAARYLKSGELLTDGEMEMIRDSDAVLLGAVGDPRVPDGILERGILLHLRRELDLYVNLRPFPELNLAIVRENTEGLYSSRGFRGEGQAVETSLNTVEAIERCADYAFTLAQGRGGYVTLVHKRNVLLHAGALWTEAVDNVARNYPGVPLEYEHIDAAAYHLVVQPARFDVILTDNMFGDILSDVAAGVGNGLGKAASANLHPNEATRPTRCVGLFEPVHGSAPDIAGLGMADATAAREAVHMLVEAVATHDRVRA